MEQADLQEGVRLGIRDALGAEVDRTNAATAARLGAAGALSLLAAFAALAVFGRDIPGDLNPRTFTLFAVLWTALLATAFALALLRVGTRRMPFGSVAAVALVGFGLVAAIGAVCPEPRVLMGAIHAFLPGMSGAASPGLASALCLGVCAATVGGIGATVSLSLRGIAIGGLHLSAFLLFLLLWPAFGMHMIGSGAVPLLACTTGLAIGSWGGVAAGLGLHRTAARVFSARSRRSSRRPLP